jgi:hypothetical protein
MQQFCRVARRFCRSTIPARFLLFALACGLRGETAPPLARALPLNRLPAADSPPFRSRFSSETDHRFSSEIDQCSPVKAIGVLLSNRSVPAAIGQG